jgi:RND family efflux transporter MFP subunit
MSPRQRWSLGIGVVTLVAALTAVSVGRSIGARQAGAVGAGHAASAPAPRAQAVELASGDVTRVRRATLVATLTVSGGIEAVNRAVLKAKVAAEVKELRVREGDPVRAGQVVGQLDDTEYRWRLRQAEETAAAAQAQLDIAERTLANNRALVDQGFISKTALDTAISSANGSRASLQAANAAAELARKSVRDSVLTAPLAGLVSRRLVQPGERVSLDAQLIEIVDLSRLELQAAVAPEQVVALRVGQPARVVVDGLARPVAATVARINPKAQDGTRSVMAYLALQSTEGLRQGLFARATIELGRRDALVVPAAALRNDQAQPYVLVADEGVARQRAVTLGERGEVDFGHGPEPAWAVQSGLADGEPVLRDTVGALPAGTALVLPAAPASAARP